MVFKSILALAGAYVLGSIPFGIAFAWLAKRIDVREHGSGRTGGTNVWRNAGFIPALLTAIFDGLKGLAGVWLARALGCDPWVAAVAGTLTVVGHNHSLFNKFKGGAGTGTSVGVAAAYWGWNALILVGVIAASMLLVGHASVGSIAVALALPLVLLLRGETLAALLFGVPVMLLTLWALRPNIKRLYRREERFLPIYTTKIPPIRLSDHPTLKKDDESETGTDKT